MFTKDEAVLVVIDMQGKLAQIVDRSEEVLENVHRLVKGFQAFDMPILWLEQYPKGLGPTLEPLKSTLEQTTTPIEKTEFSAYDNVEFKEKLDALGRKQIVLAGIETHICMYQTAVQLDEEGFDVQIASDAVSSRSRENHESALRALATRNIQETNVETMLYQLMRTSKDPAFKEILSIIK